ncbi:MAG TPA: DUF951 domain-containing protein [Firmicutes bacterium]|jgi:hypothetical protein|nr:DUF951 domain-containing protein [Bacillota bacterium]
MPVKFALGDIIQMRKKHPCGSDQWEIMRTGMDIRMRCQGCARVVLLPRRQVERSMKGFIHRAAPETGDEA